MADSTIAMERGGAKTAINLKADPEKADPIERPRAPDGADVIPGKMLLAHDAGVKLDITRQSHVAINPVASGISHYAIFNFPSDCSRPRTNRLKRRPTASRPGETPRLYLQNLRYSCRINSSRYFAPHHHHRPRDADKGGEPCPV